MMTEPSQTVETQLALINQKLDGLVEATASRGNDHENRLRSLEQFKFVLIGASVAAGGASGYLVQALVR